MTDTNPTMADAIEQRRLELGMTIGDLADAAQLTRQGLDPVRRGDLRNYNDRTIIGVARALRWRLDWYDRLVAGEQPVEGEPTELAGDEPPPWEDLVAQMQQVSSALERLAELVEQRLPPAD